MTMKNQYDAIVVGARCAGSPLAMLLARKGHRVLVVDRATFPSDTVSTHVIHPSGIAALDRWGLLDEVLATGCPPVERYLFDFGAFTIDGRPRTPAGAPGTTYAPRRTVLDAILVRAAESAGAEVREGFTFDELIVDGGSVVGIRGRNPDGTVVEERSRVVIGADGTNSRVARAVEPQTYNEKPVLQWGAYSYWRDLPLDGFEIVIRPNRGWGAIETNDGLTMIVVGWPAAEQAEFRSDVEGNFMSTLELVPEFAERVRRGTRVERFSIGGVPNVFRKPHGSGWVLVGDAGYSKDPITAQGISDAFRDAEQVADALDSVWSGARSFDDAMADHRRQRDERVLPTYEFTTQLATLEPPPPEVGQLLFAASHDQPAMDGFASVVAGTMSPVEFFAPENVGRIMGAVPEPA